VEEMSDEEEEEEEEEEQQAMAAAGQRVEQSVRVKDDEVETIARDEPQSPSVAALRPAAAAPVVVVGGGLKQLMSLRPVHRTETAPAASAASGGGFRPTADAALARSSSAEMELEEEEFLCCAVSVEECTARELQFI
jgi:hypothetical protein